MKSKLDDKRDLLASWAALPYLTYEDMAKMLRDAGVETSEAAVRRAFRKFGLQKSDPSPPVTSEFERALREFDGVSTREDELLDQVDTLLKDKQQAEQIVKRLRENQRIEDRLVTIIDRAISSKKFSQPTLTRPQPAKGQAAAHQFLLMLSDAHYGEVVRPEEAMGIKYDPEICRRRIEHVRDATIRYGELREEAYPISKLTVACLGDMLSGNIHEELEATNQLNMVDQSAEMAHILYDLAKDFSGSFEEVEFVIIPGNHPRIHKKPRYKGKFENWEFIMGKMVEGIAKYALPDYVQITVPRDMVYVHDIFDFRIAMMHGDGVKSGSFAGIPFYGLRNQREAVQALMSATGQSRVDAFILGHFHQYMFWGGECDIVINGPVKGADEYGIGTRLSAVESEQVLLEWHPEHGLVAQNRIKLGHIT